MGSQVSTSLPTPLTRFVGRELELVLPARSRVSATKACSRGIRPQPGSQT